MSAAQQFKQLPKGLHHLEVTHKNKFVARYPSRGSHPPRKFVQVKDRIARWNIVPGDKVRLMVGKPQDKYNEEVKTSGYKVYTVASVDQERNRVFLNGYTSKKPSAIRPIPDNFESYPEEAKRGYLDQKNFIEVRKPVQYSNVQLCVEDRGANSVFATRIRTSAPRFDYMTKRMVWDRFAAKLSGQPESVTADGVIPWPKPEAKKDAVPTPQDTNAADASKRSLALGSVEEIPETLIPTSMRAPPPKDQGWADEYIFKPEARGNVGLQMAMPLYLGEELSPRFSRAKKQRGWRLRRELEASQRGKFAKRTLDEWEKGGRDAGIEAVLSHDLVGLEGVTIRPRTRAEIRENATRQFDEDVKAAKAATLRARAAGKVFVVKEGPEGELTGEYEEGPKGIDLARRRARRARKVRKMEERLSTINLGNKKNQVVPPDLRQ